MEEKYKEQEYLQVLVFYYDDKHYHVTISFNYEE